MSSVSQRWAVYRPAWRAPIYLGDVLAPDRETALTRGADTYGGRVLVHRSAKAGSVSPALERAVRAMARRARRPESFRHRGGAR